MQSTTLGIGSLPRITVVEATDRSWIEKALNDVLEVPNDRLKPLVAREIATYLESKYSEGTFQVKAFMVLRNGTPTGFVSCQLDPFYKSHGRACATFGWLVASDFETCQALMIECEDFAKNIKSRKLRGPVAFPKGVGGYGIQVQGFNRQMLYGVPFGRARSPVRRYLERLGYAPDATYASMEVSESTWKSAKNVSNKFRFEYLSLDELREKKDEILDLAKGSFYAVLPDSSGGTDRFDEILSFQETVPKEAFQFKGFGAINVKKVDPLFIEAWNSCDLESIAPLAPLAIERSTGRIAGLLLGVPDLYETALGNPLTRINVDTALVGADFRGKGLFSALNNLGQLTARLFGAAYFEGTSIWYDNEAAVRSIFPHSKTARRYVVYQKRVK